MRGEREGRERERELVHDDGDHHDVGADDCTDRRNGGGASGGVVV